MTNRTRTSILAVAALALGACSSNAAGTPDVGQDPAGASEDGGEPTVHVLDEEFRSAMLEPGLHLVELPRSGTLLPLHLDEPAELRSWDPEDTSTVQHRALLVRGDEEVGIVDITHTEHYAADGGSWVADVPSDVPDWITTAVTANRFVERRDAGDLALDGFETFAFTVHVDDAFVDRFPEGSVRGLFATRLDDDRFFGVGTDQDPSAYVLMRADDSDHWFTVGAYAEHAALLTEVLGSDWDVETTLAAAPTPPGTAATTVARPVPDSDAHLEAGVLAFTFRDVEFTLANDHDVNVYWYGEGTPGNWVAIQDPEDEERFVELFTVEQVYRSEQHRYQAIPAPSDLRNWLEQGNHAAFTIEGPETYDHPIANAFEFHARTVPGNVFEDLGFDPALFIPQRDPDGEHEYRTYAHADGGAVTYLGLEIDGTWLVAAARSGNVDYLHRVVDRIGPS